MMAKEDEREELEFVQHTKAAGEAVMKQWKSLIPKEFWEHRRTARRETLLALRSLVDAAIERLEDAEENPHRQRRSNRKVKVEVD
jgi:hypothetical protein